MSRPDLFAAKKCPLCGSPPENWNAIAEAVGSGPYRATTFRIWECRTCGLGISDPIPLETDSRLLYSDRSSNQFQMSDSKLLAALKRRSAVRDVEGFCRGMKAAQILDYACGNGAFALALAEENPESIVTASDFQDEPPPMLITSHVRYRRIEDLAGEFDFVLCRHVLEHTYDPVAFLRTLRGLLRKGGVLALEVPNLRAPLRRFFGRFWGLYYVPYHPIHFSRASLHRTVVEAGFRPSREGSCEMPMIGRSFCNMAGVDHHAALVAAGVLLFPVQLAAPIIFGEPTCLRLWAVA